MTTRLKRRDAVIVGFGWTGALLAQELTDAGLDVLALERGGPRDTARDFDYPGIHDELKYAVRYALMQKPAHETLTFRNNPSQHALPMRHLGSFLPGSGVGGAGVHWNGQTWRFLPQDFEIRSHTLARYGKGYISSDMTIQDWGISYAELEPYYDAFEYLCGISGQAGNLRGRIVPGGNPFEGPRSRPYPTPPLKTDYAGSLFATAARELGYHPFPQPAGNLSQPYRNPLGIQMGQCTYCGYCERFGCEMYAKASPQTTVLPVLEKKSNFTLKTRATVLRVNLDASRKRAVGVTYVDHQEREFEQPADLVILCAYILNNVQLMLVSGIGEPYDHRTGKGVVGKNYAYQILGKAHAFFPDKRLNSFMGAGALGTIIDDFNGDNFDHSGLNFIGGGFMGVLTTGARPIEHHPTPEGTPKWGADWKKAVAAAYNHTATILTHGSVMSYRDAYLDLDPNYRDIHGLPLLRMTFDFHENDHRMSRYITGKAENIARAMNPAAVKVEQSDKHYSILPYQTTHNTGGTIMGTDPDNSVVNKYLQSWDVANVFVMGAGAFPQNAGYNPTGTLAALALHSARAIRERYLTQPGPLIDT